MAYRLAQGGEQQAELLSEELRVEFGTQQRYGLPGGMPPRARNAQESVPGTASRSGAPPTDAQFTNWFRTAVAQSLRARGYRPDLVDQLMGPLARVARNTWHEAWPVKQAALVLAALPEWGGDGYGATFHALTRPERVEVIEAVALQPRLGRLLHAHPDLLKEVSESDTVLDAFMELPDYILTTYIRNPRYVEDLLMRSDNGRRELMEAIAGEHDAPTSLLRAPGLPAALHRKVPLILAVAVPGPVAQIVSLFPQIGEVLAAQASVSSAAAFANEWSLSDALLHALAAGVDVDLVGLLGNRPLRAALQAHAGLAKLLVSVPRLLAAAMNDHLRVLGILARGPELVDVLEDLPAFAGRLARDMEWLSAAVDNTAVAVALARRPAHFDGVPDDLLLLALQESEPLPLPSASAPSASASPLERAKAASPGLRALLTDEPHLARPLQENGVLAETLALHPHLLNTPYEYRRLLSASGTGLIPHIREGSPLLAPHLLRSALRHETVRKWFLVVGDRLVSAPSSDIRRRIALEAEADPRVGKMLFQIPALAGLLSLGADLSRFSILLKGWAARPEDERIFTKIMLSGVYGALLKVSDTRRLLDVLFQDDAALIRISGKQAKLLNVLTDDMVANLQAHPQVVKELASRPAVDMSFQHWQALFGDSSMLAALGDSRNETVLRLLASAPEALREAVARPGFLDALDKRPIQQAVQDAAAKKKGRRRAGPADWSMRSSSMPVNPGCRRKVSNSARQTSSSHAHGALRRTTPMPNSVRS